jgi:hypothetical protein
MSNTKAYEFALKYNLPMQVGTDDHGRGNKYYRAIALEQKAETIHDIIRAIKERQAKLV